MALNNKYRSIICLNGELPASNFFKRPLPIIAADGAANKLFEMNVLPDIIIGDLDSVDKRLLDSCASVYDPNQSTCDFEKCLHYIEAHGLAPAIIVGFDGGHLDHVFNNINIFTGTDCLFYTATMSGAMIKKGEKINLTQPIHTKISMFGLPFAITSTNGLKWELKNKKLSFPGENSCYNRTKQENFSIEVHDGNLLLMIYHDIIHDMGRDQ